MKGQMFIQFVILNPYFFKHFKIMVGEAVPPLTVRHSVNTYLQNL